MHIDVPSKKLILGSKRQEINFQPSNMAIEIVGLRLGMKMMHLDRVGAFCIRKFTP
jgi:hypothetical protein